MHRWNQHQAREPEIPELTPVDGVTANDPTWREVFDGTVTKARWMPSSRRARRVAIRSVGRMSVVCMAASFGVAQACDEISAGPDCCAEELLRRPAILPGLASSSRR